MDNKDQLLPHYAFTVAKKSEEVEILYDEAYDLAISRFEWEGGPVIGVRLNKENKRDRVTIEIDDPEWFVAPPFLEKPIIDWVESQKAKKKV